VGNPANTNAMIAAHYAKDMSKANFTVIKLILGNDKIRSQ
jgi:hypothetical protein